MQKLLLVLFAVVAHVSAQGFGGSAGGDVVVGSQDTLVAEDAQQTNLAALDRNAAREQAKLDRQNRRRQGIQGRKERRLRRRERLAERRAQRLDARRQFLAQRYRDEASQDNFDAALSSDSSSRLAVQVVQEEENSNKFAVSSNSASRFSEGEQVGLNEEISAAEQSEREAALEEDAASLDAVNALDESENALSAAQAREQQNEARLQASDGSRSGIQANSAAGGSGQFGGQGFLNGK